MIRTKIRIQDLLTGPHDQPVMVRERPVRPGREPAITVRKAGASDEPFDDIP